MSKDEEDKVSLITLAKGGGFIKIDGFVIPYYTGIPHFEWKEIKMKRFMVVGEFSPEHYFFTRAEAVAFMVGKDNVTLYVAEHQNKIVFTKKNITVKVK